MRGIHGKDKDKVNYNRIIPAHAGNTSFFVQKKQ